MDSSLREAATSAPVPNRSDPARAAAPDAFLVSPAVAARQRLEDCLAPLALVAGFLLTTAVLLREMLAG